MAEKARCYKDLRVWQEGMKLVRMAYQLAASLPETEKFGLRSQMTRAAVSVPANIAEGQSSEYLNVCIQHLSVARGSLMEFETYILLGLSLELFQESKTRDIIAQVELVGRRVNALIRALRGPRNRPPDEAASTEHLAPST